MCLGLFIIEVNEQLVGECCYQSNVLNSLSTISSVPNSLMAFSFKWH